jgi:hypothetical protein
MIAAHLSGEPVDLEPYSPEEVSLAENALISFFEWEDQHKIEPEMVEEGMVSEEHQFGGTIDLYGEIDGKPGLVDFKTGKALYPEYFHQLAAYTALLEESGKPVKSVRIIRVGRTEDEGFEERVVDRKALEPHWQIFLHCLAIYNLKKEAK